MITAEQTNEVDLSLRTAPSLRSLESAPSEIFHGFVSTCRQRIADVKAGPVGAAT
jgi:hypothetical protein